MSEQTEAITINDEGFVPRQDGEWVPVGDGHFLACCDCGLVHYCRFRVRDGVIEISAVRRDDLTEERRNSLNGRASEIANLEWRVVEAAIRARLSYNEYGNAVASPLSRTEQEHMSITAKADTARKDLFAAVDALIAAREKAEAPPNRR